MSDTKYQNLLSKVKSILQVDPETDLDLPKIEVRQIIEAFLRSIVASHLSGDSDAQLAKIINPQWVVLAAGKGTRIDPTGTLNKNLDIWFGSQNTLQLSRSYLPGTRSQIVVINPDMEKRLENDEEKEKLIGGRSIIAVQPKPDGPGGALRAAVPAIKRSDAEFVGVAYGDEPFLSKDIYLLTLIDHFVKKADVTLCGKVPETVVEKGGLLFDPDGKFMCTKEWKEMSDVEKQEMWHRFDKGEAYTNTGITLIRKSALLKRIDRLQPHGKKGEFHHVDLIRSCYDEGLRTNAFIYRRSVISGVNRWSNVLEGERELFERQRRRFAKLGARVDPNAQISVDASDDFELGRGCYLIGRVHIGKGVKIGNYCRLENVVLENTEVGDLVGLKNVSAKDTVFEPNVIDQPVARPIIGLNIRTIIEDCRFDGVEVAQEVKNESEKKIKLTPMSKKP